VYLHGRQDDGFSICNNFKAFQKMMKFELENFLLFTTLLKPTAHTCNTQNPPFFFLSPFYIHSSKALEPFSNENKKKEQQKQDGVQESGTLIDTGGGSRSSSSNAIQILPARPRWCQSQSRDDEKSKRERERKRAE
jgi:hypothetical protein